MVHVRVCQCVYMTRDTVNFVLELVGWLYLQVWINVVKEKYFDSSWSISTT